MNVRTKVSVQFPREKIVNALRTAAASGLNAGGIHFTAQTRQKLNQHGPWGSKAGGYPGNSRGTLLRSVDLYKRAKPEALDARVGSNVPEAWYMQFGSKASKGKALTVPLNVKARNGMLAAGGIRAYAKQAGLVFIKKSRNADHIGTWVQVIGKGRKSQRVVPMVALRKAVKARPWLTLSYRDHKAGTIDAIRTQYQLRWATESRKVFAQLTKAKK